MYRCNSIARLYAKSIFELAIEEKAFYNWQKMLFFSVQIANDEKMNSLLSGVLSARFVAHVFITLCGDQLNPKFRNLIKIMAQNKRLHLLKDVLSEFIFLKNTYNKFMEADVISSYALNECQLNRISVFLKKKFNSNINLKNSINSSIIGGFIIKVNDIVIDMSLSGRLKQLDVFLNY
ncbi:F0F1 ATP synthase subunit delta [Buchnera aphidicola]|uniref:F0F1 ATP synthase subunit delta n=1 Tax=Buchnera aphidicola TaxID=9 RepID=UPI003463F350